jgi:hypothetical protein
MLLREEVAAGDGFPLQPLAQTLPEDERTSVLGVPAAKRPFTAPRTRTGQGIRLPAARSSASWDGSIVAAARYSSQIART